MISVLMSSYREDVTIVQSAVESILAQQDDEEVELIFVIDDPTNYALKHWVSANLEPRQNVIIIENKINRGLACSLNEAIAKASGRYICRMDCDDIALPHRFASQRAYLEIHHLDLVGGRMEVMDQAGQYLYTTPRLPMHPSAIRCTSRWNNCVPHPTWFGRKEVFEQRYRDIPFCEDYDFQLRALLSDFRIGNTNEVVLRYRISPNSISQGNLYKQYLYQRFITRCYRHGKIADIATANHYVEMLTTTMREQRYANASRKLNDMLASPKPLLSHIVPFIGAVLASPAYANKTARLASATLIGRLADLRKA